MRPVDVESRIRLMYGGGNSFCNRVWATVNRMTKQEMGLWLDQRRMPRPASRRSRGHYRAPTNEDEFVEQLRKMKPGDILREAIVCFRLLEPRIMPRGGWGPGLSLRLMMYYRDVLVMPVPVTQRTGVRRMKIYYRNVYIRTIKSTQLQN